MKNALKIVFFPFVLLHLINKHVAIFCSKLPRLIGIYIHAKILSLISIVLGFGLAYVVLEVYVFFLLELEKERFMELWNQDSSTVAETFPVLNYILGIVPAVIVIGWIYGAIASRKIYGENKVIKKKKHSFGESRFAHEIEIKKSELKGPGVVLGKRKNILIEKPPTIEGHMLVIGGSGSGKSRGCAIPTLLKWPGACLAIDIKGELSQKTAHVRDNVFIFNPEKYDTARYNPLKLIIRVDDAQDFARTLIPIGPNSNDPFWAQCAQGILAAAALEGAKNGHTLQDVAKRCCTSGGEELVNELVHSPYSEVQVLASIAKGMPEKTLGGVIAQMRSKLLTLAVDDELGRATSNSDFCPEDLENGANIYISVSEHLLEQYSELFTVIISQFIRYLQKRPEKKEPGVLLLLDELPRLGKLDKFSSGLATLRSRNVHILGIIQSMAQLDLIYGRDERKVIADNCPYKLVLSATDPETQKYFSDLAGQKTIMTKGMSSSGGMLPGLSSSESGVPLIRPEEWSNLDKKILFAPKLYPVEVDLAFWDQDKEMSNLVELGNYDIPS